MGIMDRLFGNTGGGVENKPGSAPAVMPPAQPATPVAAGQPNAAVAATVTSSSLATTPAAAIVPSSPLDAYGTLWDTPKDSAGKPIVPQANPLDLPIFNFDAAKIQEQVKTLDFTASLNPEHIAQIAGNDPDKANAFKEILNSIAQGAFAAGTLSTGKMVNEAMSKNNAALRNNISTDIRKTQLMDTPISNDVLQHPNAQGLVVALRQMAFNKDPNAVPAEVAKRVDDYLMDFARVVVESSPQAVAAKKVEAAKSTDFMDFMSAGR